jgi:hypothetical protein
MVTLAFIVSMVSLVIRFIMVIIVVSKRDFSIVYTISYPNVHIISIMVKT